MKIGKNIEVQEGDIVLAQLHMGEYLWVLWEMAGNEPVDIYPDRFRPLVLSKKLIRYSFAPDPENPNYYLIAHDGANGQFFLSLDKYNQLPGVVWKVYYRTTGYTYMAPKSVGIKYFHELQHLGLSLNINITRMKRYLYGKTSRKYRQTRLKGETEYVKCG